MMNCPGGPRKPDDSDHPLKEVRRRPPPLPEFWQRQARKARRLCASARQTWRVPCGRRRRTSLSAASRHCNLPTVNFTQPPAPAPAQVMYNFTVNQIRGHTNGTILLITGDADFIRPAVWCKQQVRARWVVWQGAGWAAVRAQCVGLPWRHFAFPPAVAPASQSLPPRPLPPTRAACRWSCCTTAPSRRATL